ncbi:MAG: hypothetical protein JO284_01800 [Planctomycetaceae bacterium]|nr:hypothetical protein [Planctomycetaceae bacterium]
MTATGRRLSPRRRTRATLPDVIQEQSPSAASNRRRLRPGGRDRDTSSCETVPTTLIQAGWDKPLVEDM